MTDIKYTKEQLEAKAQSILNSFKDSMQSAVEECMSSAVQDIIPHTESDAFTNYRESLRIELENEYKRSRFKNDWAVNLRRVIFLENKEEIALLISNDLLKRIQELEDQAELTWNRYTPAIETYSDLKKKHAQVLQALSSAEDFIDHILGGGISLTCDLCKNSQSSSDEILIHFKDLAHMTIELIRKIKLGEQINKEENNGDNNS